MFYNLNYSVYIAKNNVANTVLKLIQVDYLGDSQRVDRGCYASG